MIFNISTIPAHQNFPSFHHSNDTLFHIIWSISTSFHNFPVSFRIVPHDFISLFYISYNSTPFHFGFFLSAFQHEHTKSPDMAFSGTVFPNLYWTKAQSSHRKKKISRHTMWQNYSQKVDILYMLMMYFCHLVEEYFFSLLLTKT